MSIQTRCDFCDRPAKDDGLVFFQGEGHLRFECNPPRLDFCNHSCMAGYAGLQVEATRN